MRLIRDTKNKNAPINALIDCLVSFAKFSRIGPDDPFFSRWKLNRKVLHRKMVSTMLKDIARTLEYPEENFSSHCNRIGCATQLYEAGKTPEEISSIIGWTSNAVFGYLQVEPPSIFSRAEGQSKFIAGKERNVKLANK